MVSHYSTLLLLLRHMKVVIIYLKLSQIMSTLKLTLHKIFNWATLKFFGEATSVKLVFTHLEHLQCKNKSLKMRLTFK